MPRCRTTSTRVSAILNAWTPAASTAQSKTPSRTLPARGREIPTLVALGFLDQHHGDAVDDRVAEAICLADQPPAVIAELQSLLALRTRKHFQELLGDHGVDPNSATRRVPQADAPLGAARGGCPPRTSTEHGCGGEVSFESPRTLLT